MISLMATSQVAGIILKCFHGKCWEVPRSNTKLIDNQWPHRELNHVPCAEYMTYCISVRQLVCPLIQESVPGLHIFNSLNHYWVPHICEMVWKIIAQIHY